MEEFLDKLQEDHQRFSAFLLGKGPRFKAIGQALARAHQKGRRVYIVGEPPLAQLIEVLAYHYLSQFEVVACGSSRGMKRLGREVTRGDVVLAFLADASDARVTSLLRTSKGAGAKVFGVGGINAKPFMRKVAEVQIALPTRGIKTICEATFVAARILARMARAAMAEAGAQIPRSNSRRVPVQPPSEESEVSEVSDVSGTFEEEDNADRLLDADELGSALSPSPDPLSRSGSAPFEESGSLEAPVRRGSRSHDLLDTGAALDDSVSEEDEDDYDDASDVDDADFEDDDEDLDDADLDDEDLDDASADLDAIESEERSLPPLSDELESDVLPALDSAPVGLVSDGPSDQGELSFGSGILVGSDVVSAERPPSTRRRNPTSTASADPYAMEDAFLADLEMPRPPTRDALSSESAAGDEPRVSMRYTVSQCRIRWGRGGWPDDSAPAHELLQLNQDSLVFILDSDDEAGSTLQKGDELWVRLAIPAFIEPLLLRGVLERIAGTSGRGRGAHVTLRFVGV
ncbi:MAG: hypothetical protein R3F62_15800, partial [Planctomycetota bacterium]